jgi:hypothetical protein
MAWTPLLYGISRAKVDVQAATQTSRSVQNEHYAGWD